MARPGSTTGWMHSVRLPSLEQASAVCASARSRRAPPKARGRPGSRRCANGLRSARRHASPPGAWSRCRTGAQRRLALASTAERQWVRRWLRAVGWGDRLSRGCCFAACASWGGSRPARGSGCWPVSHCGPWLHRIRRFRRRRGSEAVGPRTPAWRPRGNRAAPTLRLGPVPVGGGGGAPAVCCASTQSAGQCRRALAEDVDAGSDGARRRRQRPDDAGDGRWRSDRLTG